MGLGPADRCDGSSRPEGRSTAGRSSMAVSPLSRRAGVLSLTAAVLIVLSQIMRLALSRLGPDWATTPAYGLTYSVALLGMGSLLPLAIAIGWIGLPLQPDLTDGTPPPHRHGPRLTEQRYSYEALTAPSPSVSLWPWPAASPRRCSGPCLPPRTTARTSPPSTGTCARRWMRSASRAWRSASCTVTASCMCRASDRRTDPDGR